jgi:glycosyltransferase involved in cell wall biosynthesis
MKILLINSCHYRRGGADVVYLNTGELLKQKGHQVFYFSMKYDQNLPDENAVFFAETTDQRNSSIANKIKAVPRFIYNKDAYSKLSALLDKIKPDIAHIHLFLGKLSSSILKALKEKNIPVVASVHDYRLLCPAYLFLDGQNKICEKCVNGFYLNCTIKRCSEGNLFQSMVLSADAYFRKYRMNPIDYIHRFIFVSDFIRKKHISFNAAYKTREKLLYNFVPDLDKIAPTIIRGDYFLFYGRLSREKGVETLLKAAQKAGIRLKVVGTGNLYEKFIAANYKNIEFLGYKSGKELDDLIRHASFVIVPSEWYENNPLTILEAYSHGKPVIGSAIGGIPEIIDDTKTGFLFESGNEAQLSETLVKADQLSEAEFQRMSMSAREFANSHFEPEKHYNDLMKIYTELL